MSKCWIHVVSVAVCLLYIGESMQLVNHNKDATEEEPNLPASYGYQKESSLPANGRVAVLIRGQSFRTETGKCEPEARDKQLHATTTLVWKVLDPLMNKRNNKIEIVVTDSDPCDLTQEVIDLMGTDRVVGVKHFNEDNQGDSMKHSLRVFEKELGGIEAVRKYDLILIFRHDTFWHDDNVLLWPADWRKFNFADMCPDFQRKDPMFGDECVSDIVHTMPGQYYPAFSEVVQAEHTHGCFDANSGHSCMAPIREALEPLGGKIGLALNFEAPNYPLAMTRQMNDYINIVPLKGDDNLDRLEYKHEEYADCCLQNPSEKNPCCAGTDVESL